MIKLEGCSVDLMFGLKKFFTRWWKSNIECRINEDDLYDILIDSDVPVILKYNYPKCTFDLGGVKYAFLIDNTVAIKLM